MKYNENEITAKIECDIEDFCKILEEKGYKKKKEFVIEDVFMVSKNLELEKMTVRQIISKAILIRNMYTKQSEDSKKMITVKKKEIAEDGTIISQESINCKINDIEEAKKIFEAIEYKKLMEIKEQDRIYISDDGFEIAVKDVKNSDYNLIEIETDKAGKCDTIEKIKQRLEDEKIPIYNDNYFVKKAEVELEKILKR